MGINLKDLVIKHPIELADLKGKKLAVDAFNAIFQFLSSIRQADGTPLKDSHGNVTSHLSGLFYRTINLIEAGIMPCFVFDGKAPEEKQATQEAREAVREGARQKYAAALEKGELAEAKKYAQQTSKLTGEMISESKELLDAMGLPWVQAMSEGEAQCSYMAKKGHVWAAASQDYDSILYGATRLVRNLSISGKRKIANTLKLQKVQLEMIDLSETLNYLGFDIDSFIKMALLIGTDYNPGGVSGIGPKTALKVIREGKFDEYAEKIPSWKKLFDLFKNPLVTTDYKLDWKAPDEKKLKEILVDRHDFKEDRIDAALKRIAGKEDERKQKGLGEF
ncbi:MAG: flap endonuclease-1 [DPANN group archaeon]|nr:flap endonuclease-1 [DPANN group archaeon]